jgi:NADPH:quinone reductase
LLFRRFEMKALANTPKGAAPVEFRDVPEPNPAPHEALIAVHAFSLNRGELTLMRIRQEGWQPGQDVAGVVLKEAADGSGPRKARALSAFWIGMAGPSAPRSRRTASPRCPTK